MSELGRPAEAVAPLQRAVELDPTHANAFIALGVAFARTGRADEAANALRDAVNRTSKTIVRAGQDGTSKAKRTPPGRARRSR